MQFRKQLFFKLVFNVFSSAHLSCVFCCCMLMMAHS